MRIILRTVSLLALAATIAPAAMFLAGSLDLDSVKTWMLAATIFWFAVTPWWMG